jgi:hypothetical protein
LFEDRDQVTNAVSAKQRADSYGVNAAAARHRVPQVYDALAPGNPELNIKPGVVA